MHGARRKNGEPCGSKAIRGDNVCRMHGGGARQVKAAAQARLRAMMAPALGVLEFAMHSFHFTQITGPVCELKVPICKPVA